MKILNEFVPTRKFLKLAEEIAPLVDGWNVTDSAAGFPAPSGTVVSCVLKSKYPEKEIVPIFILHYKGPVEVGGLALAAICDCRQLLRVRAIRCEIRVDSSGRVYVTSIVC